MIAKGTTGGTGRYLLTIGELKFCDQANDKGANRALCDLSNSYRHRTKAFARREPVLYVGSRPEVRSRGFGVETFITSKSRRNPRVRRWSL
jgi:hypothetical protein